MSSDSKIQAVPNVDGLTPEQTRELLANLAAAKAAYAQAMKSAETILAAEKVKNAARIETLRYEAFKVREEMAPFIARNEEIIREHTDLLSGGAENVPTDAEGVRSEAKIKFSKDEREKFAARLANERAALSKAAKSAK